MPTRGNAKIDVRGNDPQLAPVAHSLVLGGSIVHHSGVATLLAKRPGVTSVFRTSGSFASIVGHCRRLTPAVLIIDQASLESATPEELGVLLDLRQELKVLVELRTGEPQEIVERLLLAGCAGFLPQDASHNLLCRAIRAVADGEYWVSRKVLSKLFRSLLPVANNHLTSREREILVLIGRGLRNQEIADRLFISCETARWHIRSLYNKIGVHDRLAAAMYARSIYGASLGADEHV